MRWTAALVALVTLSACADSPQSQPDAQPSVATIVDRTAPRPVPAPVEITERFAVDPLTALDAQQYALHVDTDAIHIDERVEAEMAEAIEDIHDRRD